MSEYVFVYGSLKRDFVRNDWMQDSVFVMETVTVESGYDMHGYPGSFPVVVEGTHKIAGEVFQVNDEVMEDLDYLEANGDFYIRRLVQVEGMDVPVWMYVVENTDFLPVETPPDDEWVKRDSVTHSWVDPNIS